MTTLDYAKAYAAAGFSVIPVALDGSKKPVGSWKAFMSERSTSRQITAWFGLDRPYGIGLVHGAVSGNSCVIDIDDPQTAHDYIALVQSVFPDIDLLTIDTPSDGLHLLFRYPEGETVPGNLKLAYFYYKVDPATETCIIDGVAVKGFRKDNDPDGLYFTIGGKDFKAVWRDDQFVITPTKIETRGEGGYTIAPGSPESVHPSGLAYTGPHYNDGHTFHEGNFVAPIVVPTYDATTIDTLIALAKSFDESPEVQRQVERERFHSRENSPGADYNARATNQSMLELLERHGWQHHHTRADGVIEITRPGKNVREGVSATIGHCGEGNLYVWSSNAPSFEPGRIYAPFTVYGRLEHASDFTSAARELGATGYGEQNTPPTSRMAQDGPEASSATDKPAAPPAPKKETTPPAAENLIKWVLEKYELWRSENGDAYATTKETPQITYAVKGRDFARVLINQYHSTLGKVLQKSAIGAAIETLDARASFGTERRLYMRKAATNGAIYFDLGNDHEGIVEVTKDGWNIVEAAPVRFRRTEFARSIPTPERGGDLRELREILNLPAPTSMDEPDQLILAIAWLLSALGPERPYPILGVSGEQGAAKSHLTKTFKLLLDPEIGTGLTPLPSKEEKMPSYFANGFILCFDNISRIEFEIADILCLSSTAGTFKARKLYTDQDQIAIDARKPIILNGIGDMTGRQDLTDRMVMLRMGVIPAHQRRSESEIEEIFHQKRNRIMGALLDAVAEGLKNLDSTKLDVAPRMADFARWVVACEPACPWKPGEFLSAYTDNRDKAASASIEGDKIAAYIYQVCGLSEGDPDFKSSEPAPKPKSWEGSAGDMLQQIRTLARKENDHRELPHSPKGMGEKMKRLAPALRLIGWKIPETRVLNGKTIWLLIPPGVEVEASEPTLETPAPTSKPAIGTKITMPAPTPGPGYVPPAASINGTDDDPFAE